MSLYAPPQDVATEVFTRLPNELSMAGKPSGWIDANEPGQRLDAFLEGPSFDRQGNLYIVDIPFGRVFNISRQGEWKLVTQYDGWPNGLKIHRDGTIFLADYKNGIMALDPESGEVSPVLTHRRPPESQ